MINILCLTADVHYMHLSNCSKETAAKGKGFPVVFNIQQEYIHSCKQGYSDTATYKTSCIHFMHQSCTVRVAISSDVLYTLVEARCYGIGKIGQLLSNHVAVETDRNVRRFNRKGLRQWEGIVTDVDPRDRNVLHFYLFLLLCDCSAIAQCYVLYKMTYVYAGKVVEVHACTLHCACVQPGGTA